MTDFTLGCAEFAALAGVRGASAMLVYSVIEPISVMTNLRLQARVMNSCNTKQAWNNAFLKCAGIGLYASSACEAVQAGVGSSPTSMPVQAFTFCQ
jgi:hypothetical protein